MTHEQLASILTGREIGEEITAKEEAEAKSHGLVVAFGYSDDILELRGAIHDEVGAGGGEDLLIGPEGVLENKSEHEEMELWAARKYIALEKTALNTINANYSDAWEIGIDCPYSRFLVMEDGELFCVGIVFAIADLTK
jgi:hypothetical protein